MFLFKRISVTFSFNKLIMSLFKRILERLSKVNLHDLAANTIFNATVRSSHGTSSDYARLYLRLSQPSNIVSRPGLRGLRRLAFEIPEDAAVNLQNAVMCCG